MDYRGLVVFGACLAAAGAALLPACKGPDPGAISFVERESTSGEPGPSSGNASSSSGAASSSSGAATDGGGANEPFFKGEAFKFEEPQRVNTLDPLPAGHTATMAGQTCVAIGCHADNAQKFSAGGSVYANGGGPFPTDLKAKVQIRIIKADNTEFGTFYPDEDGNFYMPIIDDAFPPAGSKVAIRTEGGAVIPMVTPIEGTAGANCNSAGCHDNARRIYAK